MSHTCHAYGCRARTKPEMFMCRRHWFTLSRPLRDRIWRTYRPGQCKDWQISRAYADAAQDAVRFVAKKEGHVLTGREPELTLYDHLAPERVEDGS